MTAGSPKASDRTGGGAAVHLLACLGLLVAGAAGHLIYLLHNCPLDLAGDEAHYWEWARHPALSYYSKGPLVAYTVGASRWLLAAWSQRLTGTEVLAVRLPAIGLSVLTGLGIYVLAVQTLRRSRPALAAVAMTFTMPILAVGAILMTIDAPLVFAWAWALVCVHRAIDRDSLGAWLAAGLLIAVGVLAKYTMVLMYPVVGLLLVSDPALRRHLWRPGPYVAAILGMAGLLPIVIWNAGNGWVSFRHVAGQAGMAGGPAVGLMGLWIYLGGQAAVIGVLWLIGIIWAIIDVWGRPCGESVECHPAWSARLLVLATAVPLLAFLPFSFVVKIQPNWPVTSLVGGAILLVLWLGRRLRLPTPRGRAGARVFVAVGIVLGAGAVLVMHRTDWLMPMLGKLAVSDAAVWDLTPAAKYDPAARLRGWSQLGRAVGEVLADQQRQGRSPFVLTDDYQTASEIAFYCPGNPTTYDIQAALGGRMSQYDIWENPLRERTKFTGRPCIYVGSLDSRLAGAVGRPAALPGIRRVRTVEHRVGGYPVRRWTIYVCDAYVGFDETSNSARRY